MDTYCSSTSKQIHFRNQNTDSVTIQLNENLTTCCCFTTKNIYHHTEILKYLNKQFLESNKL